MSSSGFLTYHIRVKLKTWIQAKDSFTLKWSWWWPYRSKFSSCLCDRPLTVVAGRKSRKQSWWSTACDGCTVLPQIQNRGVQGQRGVEGIREAHHTRRFTDTTADSSWGLWSMSDLWLTEKCRDRFGQAPSVSCGMPVKIVSNVFPTNTAVWLRRYLPRGKTRWCQEMTSAMFWGQMRRKCLGIKNNCRFLLSLGCWVEMPVVGGGYRVDRPHPISSMHVN